MGEYPLLHPLSASWKVIIMYRANTPDAWTSGITTSTTRQIFYADQLVERDLQDRDLILGRANTASRSLQPEPQLYWQEGQNEWVSLKYPNQLFARIFHTDLSGIEHSHLEETKKN